MKTSKQISIEWNLSIRTINDLCNKGKIQNAIKDNGHWLIPDNALKPIDKRVSTKKYLKPSKNKKPLPVGISDYVRAQKDYYYIDKTLFIKEILDRKSLVTLFTRPRRFGKTLNMDMLRTFFEISKEDTSIYFKDKNIWNCGKEYQNHQGKYPVIFITFKDVKFDSFKDTIDKISYLLVDEFGRHSELLSSDNISDYEKDFFSKILNRKASIVELSSSLQALSLMLNKHYKIAPIIIIDEYDTPITEGFSKNYYDEIIGFMRNFFSGAFKDNSNLSYGFLTGILKIAQESIFSGLNNLTIDSIMDNEYDSYFGFTESEIKNILEYYNKKDKESELKNWYDGYLFGKTEIYNPWSVINYISKDCTPQAYWVNTGKNEILKDILNNSSTDIIEKLYSLLQNEIVVVRINQNVIYRSLLSESENIYSILFVSGYLKVTNKELQGDGTYICNVKIPNKEIASIYKNDILSHLYTIGAIEKTTSNKIVESLYLNDFNKLQKAIEEYLSKTASFYDTATESFYHGLVIGLVSLMDDKYFIKSNRESGDGRYDISMTPKNNNYPGIIIELKYGKNLTGDQLSKLADEALAQINKMKYDSEIKEKDIKKIIKLGLSFSNKNVCIKSNN